MSIVLGVDPGINNTGWGAIELHGNSLKLIDSGLIKNNSGEPSGDRLFKIFQGLEQVIAEHNPSAISLEITFVNKKNPMSALSLGYSRAVVLLLASMRDIPIFEYTPNAVKKAVTGSGHASKEQVRYMVERLLSTTNISKALDVSDALAIAMCHVFTARL